MVSSKEECQLVATILGLGDTTPTTLQPPGIPPGCMISSFSPPALGWNAKVEGVPCGARWDCLCVKGYPLNFIICKANQNSCVGPSAVNFF